MRQTPDGNLYLLSEKGVRRAVPGGTLAETVWKGSMYTFGSPLAAVRGFTALPGNTFALAVQTEEGGRVRTMYLMKDGERPCRTRRCVFTR